LVRARRNKGLTSVRVFVRVRVACRACVTGKDSPSARGRPRREPHAAGTAGVGE
jgi:hypothetical protein